MVSRGVAAGGAGREFGERRARGMARGAVGWSGNAMSRHSSCGAGRTKSIRPSSAPRPDGHRSQNELAGKQAGIRIVRPLTTRREQTLPRRSGQTQIGDNASVVWAAPHASELETNVTPRCASKARRSLPFRSEHPPQRRRS